MNENTEVYYSSTLDDVAIRFNKTPFNLVIIEFKHSILFHTDMNTIFPKPISAENRAIVAVMLQQEVENNAQAEELPVLIFGESLIIDPQHHFVKAGGKQIRLARKEFELLYFLASRPEQVLTPKQLYQQIWNDEPPSGVDSTIKAHISVLRKKLAAAGIDTCIQNIWGIGYKFVSPQI